MYVCIVCIDSSARRPNRTEFEKTTEFEKATARLGADREVSEERLRSVREASEARPGGVRGSVREVSEERPGAVRKTSKLCSKGLRGKTGRAHEKSGNSARSCLTFSVRTVKLLSVFGDVRGGAFSTASAMDFHDFANHRACAGS